MSKAISAIPGGTVVIRLQVRKYDGTLANLDGADVATALHCTGVADEPVDQVVEADSQTRLAIVSGAQIAARAGKQIRGRALITPVGGYETVPAEFLINVAAP